MLITIARRRFLNAIDPPDPSIPGPSLGKKINSRRGGRRDAMSLVAILVAIGISVWHSEPAAAQATQARDYPNAAYFVSLKLIDDGDYVSAERAIRNAARSGLRTSNGPWVDSICYFAMLGECYYQMGDLSAALEQFNSALQLYVAQSNWMLNVQFPAITDSLSVQVRTPITWGAQQRRTTVPRLPDRYQILQGTTNTLDVLQQGGVLAPPEFILINAHEIVRCTGLAMRRRAEIMGVACRLDPLSERLVAALSTRPAPPNHWSQSWIDGLLGLAYVSSGRNAEAVSELTRGIQLGNQYDHPLTASILIELGKLAMKQQQYASAGTMFLEATFAAAFYEQYDVMAEAFRWGTVAHLLSNVGGMYPPLDAAIQWSRRERAPVLEAGLLISQAQNAAEIGQTAPAAGLIDRARRAMTRSEMARGVAGSRLSYVAALVGFQSANLNAGEAAWKDVAAYQSNQRRIGSQRLFEIGLVHKLITSGRVTPRVANDLYAEVLREPTGADWRLDPVETLTTVLAPNLAAYENWLNVALERNEVDRAIEIADRIRRLRFYSTLPMGGRLLSLGWILEAPLEALPEQAVLQRQDLLNRFPRYAEVAQKATAVRQELNQEPIVPANPEAAKARQKLWSEWATASQLQELMLREIALRREVADFVFPPPLNAKQFQAKLTPEQVVLAFLMTSQNQLHGFLISKSSMEHFKIDGAGRLVKDISELLRQYGQFDRNTPIDSTLLTATEWQEASGKIWDAVSNAGESGALRDFKEMVIVPDRFLWYLPFESLMAGAGEGKSALLNLVRIRYVPTVSLAIPDRRPASAAKETVVVVGKLFSNEDATYSEEAATELRAALTDVTQLSTSLPASSALISALGKRTLVLHDASDQPAGAYDWAPMQLDRDKPGSALAQWIALPWGAPDQFIIPTFHSSAETALRRGATGDDLFLTICGLMASGSRTVLLSRWRTGGQTSIDLMREFVQELPYSSAANSWQRSVGLAKEKELRMDREPRVKPGNADASIKANHPFFWSGYLLADTGAVPPKDDVKKVEVKKEDKKDEKKPIENKDVKKQPEKQDEKKGAKLEEKEPKKVGKVEGKKNAKKAGKK